jgi:outer membrane lipoprotein-sorting protein
MHPSRLLLALLLVAGPACADPAADLKAAYGKLIEATSFRATLTDLKTGKAFSQIEFAAPDRYAITAEGGMRQVVIGRTMHMDLGGQVMRVPLPENADPSQYRNQRALDELAAGLQVEQRPDSNDTGEPARVYHFVSQAEGKPVATLTWVSKASGLPVQVQTDAGGKGEFRYQIRYRDFNDAGIVITEPR